VNLHTQTTVELIDKVREVRDCIPEMDELDVRLSITQPEPKVIAVMHDNSTTELRCWRRYLQRSGSSTNTVSARHISQLINELSDEIIVRTSLDN